MNISRQSVEEAQVSLKSDKNNAKCRTLLIIFRSLLVGMRNVSDKSCRENQHTFYVQ